MPDKELKLRSNRTGQHLTISGKNLHDALKAEGLNPEVWTEVIAEPEPPAPSEE